jgi:hypothetical protein
MDLQKLQRMPGRSGVLQKIPIIWLVAIVQKNGMSGLSFGWIG